MNYKEIKEQIDKGNLFWREVLTLKAISHKYRQNLRHEVIKRNIPWFIPCKDWVADRVEMHMTEEGKYDIHSKNN